MRRTAPALLVALALALGCGQAAVPGAAPPPPAAENAEVAAELAKLDPADRALVEAQEWCAVSTDSRLGAMGPPLKVDLAGGPAFVCCGGCMGRAKADPAATLAKVEELKAKKAAH